ncbi:putative ABC transport system permease protein [Hypnocyclicus thermotrophus]|uniref:ABC transport system permease protein n=1 Tax=Hypnocyclicus thermotrophus TaxID=1627895 RepID=A0AA46DXD7_9FUSO|nr:ABC transporter permease [Hypnocyclicus thermotrophus]TDT68035.1 putative ABC transport system permease protein [Hypnocyclicus thermotrophus]
MTKDISIYSLGLLILFIIPLIITSIFLKLDIIKKTFFSIFKMCIQLFLVSLYLNYIFTLNNRFINLLYLLIMIIIATLNVANNSNLKLKKFIFYIFISIAFSQVLTLFIFNKFIINLSNIFDAKYIIAVGGMLLGNEISGTIITLNSLYNEVSKKEEKYLFLLTIGANKLEALQESIKISILSSITPTIASMSAIGIVSLPGMMTGQILAGSIPTTAIKYQIAIMLAILNAKFISSILIIIFFNKKCFTPYSLLDKEYFK